MSTVVVLRKERTMKIKDPEGLTKYLVQWMQHEAEKSHTTNGCVGLSGGVDSALVLALCVRAFPETLAVMMPCGSNPDSINRAREVVEAQLALSEKDSTMGLISLMTVNLDNVFDDIVGQAPPPRSLPENFLLGSLRSCLRAPVLDYLSKGFNALIYGTGNRDEDEIFRYYQKRGDGCVDNNPIASLHKSEVYQLSEYLGVPESVLSAVPSADLWGGEDQSDEEELGVTYPEIEWVTQANAKFGILKRREECETPAAFAEKYSGYTTRQLEVIEKAFQFERATRHKAAPPTCPKRIMVARFVEDGDPVFQKD